MQRNNIKFVNHSREGKSESSEWGKKFYALCSGHDPDDDLTD